MRTVLVMIAGPAGLGTLPPLATAVAEALSIKAEPVWLSPGEACEFEFETGDATRIEQITRDIVVDAAIDVLVLPAFDRRKRLLVADMESTIILNEMVDELAELRGIGGHIAEITRRTMNGELDFAASLEARVALLAGADRQVLEAAAARIRLTPGAQTLVATMRRAGATTALVTGGFTIFAEHVAGEVGFDRVEANRLELVDGRVAGTVAHPILDARSKREILLGLAVEQQIAPALAIAVGDGANDLPMLSAAGLGIAFRAKPLVAASARWRIDHGDLTGLLYAQGYRRDEFAT